MFASTLILASTLALMLHVAYDEKFLFSLILMSMRSMILLRNESILGHFQVMRGLTWMSGLPSCWGLRLFGFDVYVRLLGL